MNKASLLGASRCWRSLRPKQSMIVLQHENKSGRPDELFVICGSPILTKRQANRRIAACF